MRAKLGVSVWVSFGADSKLGPNLRERAKPAYVTMGVNEAHEITEAPLARAPAWFSPIGVALSAPSRPGAECPCFYLARCLNPHSRPRRDEFRRGGKSADAPRCKSPRARAWRFRSL